MTQPLLHVNNLEVVYHHTIQVLKGLSLSVPEGAIVALLGSNGAGKTTTLKAISGLLPLENGEIVDGEIAFRGASIAGKLPHRIAQDGLFQVMEGRRIFEHLTVEENLEAATYARRGGVDLGEALRKVFAYFPRLRERRKQLGGYLSGGEQQMLAIGRALVAGPSLLLLDEPSLGLSPLLVQEIFRIIAGHQPGREGLHPAGRAERPHGARDRAATPTSWRTARWSSTARSEKLREDRDVQEFYLGSRGRRAGELPGREALQAEEALALLSPPAPGRRHPAQAARRAGRPPPGGGGPPREGVRHLAAGRPGAATSTTCAGPAWASWRSASRPATRWPSSPRTGASGSTPSWPPWRPARWAWGSTPPARPTRCSTCSPTPGATIVVAEDQEQVDKILEVGDRLPAVRHIVVPETKGLRSYTDPRILSWDELEERGERLAAERPGRFEELVAATRPDDVAFLIYTSGTTGFPKGAMISHRNVLGQARAAAEATGITGDATRWSPTCPSATWPSRSSRCYLPLHLGMTVSFAEGIRTIQEDLREIAPTVFLGVPRIWEKMQAGIQVKIQETGRLRRALFEGAMARGPAAAPCAAWPGSGPGRSSALRGAATTCSCSARCRTSSGCAGPGPPSRPPPPSPPRCCSSSTPWASRCARATG